MQHLETLIAALDQCEAAFQQQAPTLTGEAASLAGNHLSVLGHHRSMLEKLRREATQGAPKRNRLDRGEFRLLFTFDERAAETAFEGAARAAQAAGTATPEQLIYLTMRADFNDAAHINLDDTAVHAALDFYVLFDLLTPERREYVLTGYRPDQMPEPEPDGL